MAVLVGNPVSKMMPENNVFPKHLRDYFTSKNTFHCGSISYPTARLDHVCFHWQMTFTQAQF